VVQTMGGISQVSIPDDVRFERTLILALRFSTDALAPALSRRLAAVDGESHRHLPPALTWTVDVRRGPLGPEGQAAVYPDFTNPRTTPWTPIAHGFHHLIVSCTRASGPKGFDGIFEIHLDGQPWALMTDLNLYWRHYPTTAVIDQDLAPLNQVFIGASIPQAYLGPVVHRRKIRRRR